MGIFFIQKTGGDNIFNFLVSAYLFLSIFCALSLDWWQKKIPKKINYFFIFIVVLLTIPRVFYDSAKNLKFFLKNTGFFIAEEELQIYNFLNKKAKNDAKIVIDPDFSLIPEVPYPSLFLNVYPMLSGKNILILHGLDVTENVKMQDKILKSYSEVVSVATILENNISYLVLFENRSLHSTPSASFANSVYKNEKGEILEIDKEKLSKRLDFLNKN